MVCRSSDYKCAGRRPTFARLVLNGSYAPYESAIIRLHHIRMATPVECAARIAFNPITLVSSRAMHTHTYPPLTAAMADSPSRSHSQILLDQLQGALHRPPVRLHHLPRPLARGLSHCRIS